MPKQVRLRSSIDVEISEGAWGIWPGGKILLVCDPPDGTKPRDDVIWVRSEGDVRPIPADKKIFSIPADEVDHL